MVVRRPTTVVAGGRGGLGAGGNAREGRTDGHQHQRGAHPHPRRRRCGDKVAIIAGDRRITYGELDARSSQVANALAAEGVGVQDHVAFLDKNSPEHLEVVFGAAKLNAVSVAVNWRLAPPEVAYIVNDADAKVLVVGADFTSVLDAIAGELRHREEDRRDRPPRRLRVLRRLGGAPAGHGPGRDISALTTSPCSSTRRARPAAPRA